MRWMIAIVLFTAGCGRADHARDPGSELAKATVHKLAFEAYPQWSASHPDKECPAQLDELAEYIDKLSATDPWGHAYKMYCGASMPQGARGFAVSSPGPDGKDGTADDVRSW